MGQKTNPISNRIGIIRGWDSNWYGGTDYASRILEDAKIREYLNARISKVNLSKIVIERTLKLITVTIHTARPGVIIGKGGQEVDKLKEELKKISNKEVQINIFEVKRPEVDANIVANNIARQVEGRVSYRRAIKMAIASTMRVGAEGIKVLISGRLGGAEMARSELYKEGRTPLHTFRADIDYALAEATLKWVYLVSKYGSATVKFMANVTSLLTQVYQQTLQLLRVTTSVANAVVVVVAKAVTERTTNNLTRYVLNQKVTQTGHLFFGLFW